MPFQQNDLTRSRANDYTIISFVQSLAKLGQGTCRKVKYYWWAFVIQLKPYQSNKIIPAFAYIKYQSKSLRN